MNYYWVERVDDEFYSVSKIEVTKGRMGFKHAKVIEVLYRGPLDKDEPIKVGFTTTLLGDQVLQGEAELFDDIFGDK